MIFKALGAYALATFISSEVQYYFPQETIMPASHAHYTISAWNKLLDHIDSSCLSIFDHNVRIEETEDMVQIVISWRSVNYEYDPHRGSCYIYFARVQCDRWNEESCEISDLDFGYPPHLSLNRTTSDLR